MQALGHPAPSMEVNPRIAALMEAAGLKEISPTYASDLTTGQALNGLQDIRSIDILVHGYINQQDGWFGWMCDVLPWDPVIGGRHLVIGPADDTASTNDELTTSKLISIRRFLYRSQALHVAAHTEMAVTTFDTDSGAAHGKALFMTASHAVLQKIYIQVVLTLLNAPFMTSGSQGNMGVMYPLQHIYGLYPSSQELILGASRYILSANSGRAALTNCIAMITATRMQQGRQSLDTIYTSQSVAAMLNAPSLELRALNVGDAAAASVDRGDKLEVLAGQKIVPVSIGGPQMLGVCPFENVDALGVHYTINGDAIHWVNHAAQDRAFESFRICTFNGFTSTPGHAEVPISAVLGAPIWADGDMNLIPNQTGFADVASMFYPTGPLAGTIADFTPGHIVAFPDDARAQAVVLWNRYIKPSLPRRWSAINPNVLFAIGQANYPVAGDDLSGGAAAGIVINWTESVIRFLGLMCLGFVPNCRFVVIQYTAVVASAIVLAQKKCVEARIGQIHATKETTVARHMVKFGFDGLASIKVKDPTNVIMIPSVWASRVVKGGIGNLANSIYVPENGCAAAGVQDQTTLKISSLKRYGRAGVSALSFCFPINDDGFATPPVVSITGNTPDSFLQLAGIQDVSDDLAMHSDANICSFAYARRFNSNHEAEGYGAHPCLSSVRTPSNTMPDDEAGLPWASLQGYQQTFRPGTIHAPNTFEVVTNNGVSPIAKFCTSRDAYKRLMNDVSYQ